jgi:hypothetical protein
VQFKLAILSVLAKRPDGRGGLDEFKCEVEALTASEDQPQELSTALDDIDIFQSGLVVPEDSLADHRIRPIGFEGAGRLERAFIGFSIGLSLAFP